MLVAHPGDVAGVEHLVGYGSPLNSIANTGFEIPR